MVTSDFLEESYSKKDKYAQPGGPLYEFAEIAMAADPNNNEVLSNHWSCDTIDGNDRIDYGYHGANGMSIVTPTLSKVRGIRDGFITHFAPWTFNYYDDRYNKHWLDKFTNWDIEVGENIPFVILGRVPVQDIIDQLNKTKSTKYVLPL
tara:strand:- start:52 stop:498 length:447 start_codon:yes stop_codon:yes gene_type:complete